jgi:ubiquinone/menaquinone biosynthesis C-methylase UbiE
MEFCGCRCLCTICGYGGRVEFLKEHEAGATGGRLLSFVLQGGGGRMQNPVSNSLTSLEYSQEYYEEHVDAGLDYLGHGFWQEQYGLMVAEATQQGNYERPFLVDAGCACGSILQGFRKTGIFPRVMGLDLSEHMIKLGRQHFGFTTSELIHGSIADIPVESGSVSLVHSAQVLEHIPDSLVDKIISEFARVLRPGGRAFLCLDAMRTGENKEMYMGDPTHVNIQPVIYWTTKLQRRGLLFDVEAYDCFVRSKRRPTDSDARTFFETYPYWSTWTLIKSC